MPVREARVGETVQYRNQDGETQDAVVRGKQGAAPTAPTGTATTGGTLAGSTTFGYKLTAVVNVAETAASAEEQAATGVADNAINLDWSATPVTGATSYKVYGRTAGGPWGFLAEVTGTSYLDDGSDTPGASPPATDAAAIGFRGAHDRVVRNSVAKATTTEDTDVYFNY